MSEIENKLKDMSEFLDYFSNKIIHKNEAFDTDMQNLTSCVKSLFEIIKSHDDSISKLEEVGNVK